MTTIPLSARSSRRYAGLYEVLLDDADSAWAMAFDWSADVHHESGRTRVYAYRWIRFGVGRSCPKIKRYLHRDVAERVYGLLDLGVLVDHRDGNGLNNQRLNIRMATHAQNCHNSVRSIANSSGFKGVAWHGQNKTWRARIKVNGREVLVGLFASAEQAARAYDAAALKYRGEFARLNFPVKDATA